MSIDHPNNDDDRHERNLLIALDLTDGSGGKTPYRIFKGIKILCSICISAAIFVGMLWAVNALGWGPW